MTNSLSHFKVEMFHIGSMPDNCQTFVQYSVLWANESPSPNIQNQRGKKALK